MLSEILELEDKKLASKLRERGRTVDVILDNKKLKWAFRHADRIGASRLVMIMPEEWKSGRIKIKDLITGQEDDILVSNL